VTLPRMLRPGRWEELDKDVMTTLIESVGLAPEEPRQFKKSVVAKKPELAVGKRAPRTRPGATTPGKKEVDRVGNRRSKKSAASKRRPPATRRRG